MPKLELPLIPAKRYFTIGEVSVLTGVKPHRLRYWEQEFSQLRRIKRRCNRRYYQRDEVLFIRKIRSLLYDDGFTLQGARRHLDQETPPMTAKEVRQELCTMLEALNSSSSLCSKA